MTHQLEILCPSPIFGVPVWVCECRHRSYTYDDWTTHTQQETP